MRTYYYNPKVDTLWNGTQVHKLHRKADVTFWGGGGRVGGGENAGCRHLFQSVE